MRRRELTGYFAFAFAWIWAIAAFYVIVPSQANAIFGPMSALNALFILAAWGPNIAAIVLTAIWHGRAGVLGLLRRFLIWRVPGRWYAFILLGIPALGLAAALLEGSFMSSPLGSAQPGRLARLGPIFLSIVITGALGEEVGWRGFALPRLLRRWNPIAASLILGSLWGFWHLPSFLASGTPQVGTSLSAFMLGAVTLSTIATWIFSHTRGSVLLAALLHFSANLCLAVLGASFEYFSGLLLVLCIALIFTRKNFWFSRLPVTEALDGPAAMEGRSG